MTPGSATEWDREWGWLPKDQIFIHAPQKEATIQWKSIAGIEQYLLLFTMLYYVGI